MKILIKTLQNKQFEIEVQEDQSVRKVKEQIEEQKKAEGEEFPADGQKLIALGKVMEDEKTLKDYNIVEGKFLVVMLQKPKPKPKPKEEPAQAPAQPAAPTNPPAQTEAQNPPASTPASQAQAQPAAAQEQPAAASFTPEQQADLTEMESMGFPRDQCEAALRAAFGHKERAIEYLLTGIPDNIPQQQEAQQPASNPAGGAPTGGAGAAGAGGAGDFSSLVNNPMFGQLRERILQDPNFFQQFMQQLAQTQPQLYQQIQQNPQAFLQLLMGGQGMPGMDGGDEGQDPPGVIRVTQEEKDAIERLQGLGFPRHRAIEAFMACDKNEEWAANYLFENMGADEQWEQQVAQEESAAEAGVQPQADQPAQQQNQDQQQQPEGGNNDGNNAGNNGGNNGNGEGGNGDDEEGSAL